MFVRSLRSFFGSLFSKREQLRRTLARPRVEALEERWAPAMCVFSTPAGTGGAWEEAANWTNCNGGIPQPGDDVTISNPGRDHMEVTLSSSAVIRRLTGTGNANLTTRLVIQTNGSLRPTELVNTLQASTNFTLRMENNARLSVHPNGAYSFSGSRFDYNSGTIEVNPAGTPPFINLISSRLSLGAGATSTVPFVATGTSAFDGRIGTGQTIWVQGNNIGGHTTLTVAPGTTNAGTILLQSIHQAWNSNLIIASGGALTNLAGGVIRAERGNVGTRVITGDLTNQTGGLIDAVGIDLAIDAGVYQADGGLMQGPVYVLDRLRVTASPPVNQTATILLGGDTTLLSNNPERTLLWVQGRDIYQHAVLTVSPGTSNAGTIRLESIHQGWASNLVLPGGARFTNLYLSEGGIIEVNRGTAGPRTITSNPNNRGALVNEGRINVATNTELTINNMVYEAAGGDIQGPGLVLDQVRVTASPLFRPDTTILLAGDTALLSDNLARTILWVQGRDIYQHAVLTVLPGTSNAGTIRLQSIHQAWASNLVILSDTLTNLPGGTIQTFFGTSGPRVISGQLVNLGTLQISTNLTIQGGALQNTPQGEITGSGSLNFANPFTNFGTISVPAGMLTINDLRNYDHDSRTLTGGTYRVTGTLRLGNTATSIQTLAANVTLTGATSTILPLTGAANALANLAVIRPGASFEVNNRDFTVPVAVANFQNEGRLSVINGSRFQVTSGYTQAPTAVANIDNGRLRIQGSFHTLVDGVLTGGTYLVAGPDDINLGILQFNGTIAENAATIVLRGPGASIRDLQEGDALRDFAVNRARFTVERYAPEMGRNHVLARALQNTDQGTITVGAESSLSGEFTNLAGGALTGGTFVVGGTLRFTNGDGDLQSLAASLTIQPGGAVRNAVDANLLTNLQAIGETGTLGFSDGADFSTVAALINQGTLIVGPGTIFRIGANFTNEGTVRVLAEGLLAADFRLTNFDPETGRLTGGTYVVAGTFRFAAANIRTLAATFTLDAVDAATAVVNGIGLSAFRNFAANEGVFTLQGGAFLTLPGAFRNEGTVSIGAGSALTLGGDYTQQAGGTVLRDGYIDGTAGRVLVNGGELSGSGAVLGNVVNAARVTVGGLRAAGILYIAGDYTQTAAGTLNLELGGTTAGENFDQLVVTGLAMLAGQLEVTLLGDYFPSYLDCFDVIVAGNRVGTFDPPLFPDLGAELFFEAIYGESGLQLCVNAR